MKNIRLLLLLVVLNVHTFAVTITEDTILDEDTTYDENVTVDGALLDLNGHTLIVNGSFKTINKYGRLRMQHSDDKLSVTGDVTFAGASTYEDLTKGVLEVKGNFYQVGTRTKYKYDSTKNSTDDDARYQADNAYSFYPTEEFKVVLNGDEKQVVNLEASRYSRFMDLEIANSSSDGVLFEQFNVVGDLIRNDNKITLAYIENWKLTEDYTVPNDLSVNEVLDLNGHQLIVEGNFETKGFNGRLRMQHSDDKLSVTGDVTFAGASTYEDLTKGVLEVKGNFYQVGTRTKYKYDSTKNSTDDDARYQADNAYSFYPTEEFKVVLNGDEKQVVNLEASRYSRFMDLEIANSSSDGVLFETNTTVEGIFYTTPELYEIRYKNRMNLNYGKYLDSSFYYLHINSGMNFITLPNIIELSLDDMKTIFENNISTVWIYDGENEEWQGFSTQIDKIEQFKKQSIRMIEGLKKADGIVVNSLSDQTLLFPRAEAYNIKELKILEELSSGWHFLGSSRTLTVEEIKKLNSDIIAIWSFKNGKWFASASEGEFIMSIEKQGIDALEELEANQAFWVYVK